jgi:hypothetical protein
MSIDGMEFALLLFEMLKCVDRLSYSLNRDVTIVIQFPVRYIRTVYSRETPSVDDACCQLDLLHWVVVLLHYVSAECRYLKSNVIGRQYV